ncbi:ribbon-helix-helix domain-containing protein [Aquibacillus sp. 3ASR75-11]|uniref:Ribbon-helix-helix domain-containing protein n=1 Tax=Terrihalobacillus insolitus TaxID=2950438 RepID=A0A9X3WRH1_9BACI|nr:CopG family transcriptional regulator [Terrihalobacillus insolitus]MDC3411966.1 ribbon-helix-helix domain-containing protein [Terrihalobacillus insolitus]MDC3423348.1 ribbon-helix-helix domain-containing protein [Terrihalobacillus insolitus]
MNKEKMVRKQIYLEPKQDKFIKKLATGQGKTEAEIIREAIEHYLVSGKSDLSDPLHKLLGMAKSQVKDGSLKHDQYIYLEQKENFDEER